MSFTPEELAAMAAADAVTADCDHDGVAQSIARFCFGEE